MGREGLAHVVGGVVVCEVLAGGRPFMTRLMINETVIAPIAVCVGVICRWLFGRAVCCGPFRRRRSCADSVPEPKRGSLSVGGEGAGTRLFCFDYTLLSNSARP
ncbi:hypothetical protein BT67DRAFT_124102 [Trichocladium antarcticum]|uniref:Uncharacterized protein n=1 Tax=Trichocladium antarcticum TaxID=1450529 RepID=A0AAN6ZGT3_9PEZI|nr:hypothetical protein BT67DRAFT_124102 [Trichocladium antarcticum]